MNWKLIKDLYPKAFKKFLDLTGLILLDNGCLVGYRHVSFNERNLYNVFDALNIICYVVFDHNIKKFLPIVDHNCKTNAIDQPIANRQAAEKKLFEKGFEIWNKLL